MNVVNCFFTKYEWCCIIYNTRIHTHNATMILPSLTYLEAVMKLLKVSTFTLAPIEVYYLLLTESLNVYYKIVVGNCTEANKEYLTETMVCFNEYVVLCTKNIYKNKALAHAFTSATIQISKDIKRNCPIDDEHARKYISSGLEIIRDIINLKISQYITFNDTQKPIKTLEEPHDPWIIIDDMYIIKAFVEAIFAIHNPQSVYKHTPMGLINMTALNKAISVVSSDTQSNPNDVILLLHILYNLITPLESFTMSLDQHTFPRHVYANYDAYYNKIRCIRDNPINILVDKHYESVWATNILSDDPIFMDPKDINNDAVVAIDLVINVVKSKMQLDDDIKKILVYLPLYYYLLSLKMLYV